MQGAQSACPHPCQRISTSENESCAPSECWLQDRLLLARPWTGWVVLGRMIPPSQARFTFCLKEEDPSCLPPSTPPSQGAASWMGGGCSQGCYAIGKPFVNVKCHLSRTSRHAWGASSQSLRADPSHLLPPDPGEGGEGAEVIAVSPVQSPTDRLQSGGAN